MPKLWIYLNADTFLWIKGDRGIVYNSNNHKSFAFENTNYLTVITKRLQNATNLYCVGIQKHRITEQIDRWIHNLRDIDSGDLVVRDEQSRPVHYTPILNIQSRAQQAKDKSDRSERRYFNKYLHELTIYVNGDINGSDLFYKQQIYPVKSEKQIPWGRLQYLLLSCQHSFLNRINICGNIFEYDDIDKLIDCAKKINQCSIHLYVKIETLILNLTNIDKIGSSHVHLIVDRKDQLTLLDRIVDRLKGTLVTLQATVTSADDLHYYDQYISCTKLENIEFIPLYTGENTDFFERNVFLSKSDIVQDSYLTKRDIFAHQGLNTNFFGKLTILSDGKVYANVNFTPIGSLTTQIHELIVRAMKPKSPWLYTRKAKPCSDCEYQWLCPSISNYELVFGRNNLCNLMD